MALNYSLLGGKIKEIRKAKKISQTLFAEMIDKSTTFVSRMERGEKGPGLETLVLIADVLTVSLDNLLEGNRIPLPQESAESKDELSNCSPFERYVLTESRCSLMRILRDGEKFRNPDT